VCGDDGGQGCAVEVKTNSKKSEFGPMIGHKATRCQQSTRRHNNHGRSY